MKPRTQLRFQLGECLAPPAEVRLHRGRILYTPSPGPSPSGPPQVIRPTEAQWLQFWQAMEQIGVWSWLPDYTNHHILDGTQWSLTLSHAGRQVKCEGSNAYPGTDSVEVPSSGPFASFLQALATLVGKPLQ